MRDHVHLLVDFHPDNHLSSLIGSMKSASSRIIRKDFAAQLSKTHTKSAFWSGSYYVASTGGAPIESNFGLHQIPRRTSKLTLSQVEGLIASVPPAIRYPSPPS
ncbi:MAG: IS200/IS605 family transposase [Coleofasciculus chthonoplastes F1-TOW-03]